MEIPESTLIGTVARAASIWLTSLFGFYLFLPTILGSNSYSTSPLSITLYYLFWIILTIYSFWSLYRDWKAFEGGLYIYGFLGLGSIAIILYFTFILPQYEPINWSPAWPQPSEILYATPQYFLPKSFDILLQQLLLAALVLSFRKNGFNINTLTLWCAGLFGGAHLLLIFGGNNLSYILVFTAAAIGASYVFPRLILDVKNGLVYSYFLHWLFYAIVIVLVRMILG